MKNGYKIIPYSVKLSRVSSFFNLEIEYTAVIINVR